MIIVFARVAGPYVRPHFSKSRKTKQLSSENSDRYWVGLWVWPSGSLMAHISVEKWLRPLPQYKCVNTLSQYYLHNNFDPLGSGRIDYHYFSGMVSVRLFFKKTLLCHKLARHV